MNYGTFLTLIIFLSGTAALGMDKPNTSEIEKFLQEVHEIEKMDAPEEYKDLMRKRAEKVKAGLPILINANITNYIDRDESSSSINDLHKLIIGGLPPYTIIIDEESAGELEISPNGVYTFHLSRGFDRGGFKYHVRDAKGNITDEAEVTIIRRHYIGRFGTGGIL